MNTSGSPITRKVAYWVARSNLGNVHYIESTTPNPGAYLTAALAACALTALTHMGHPPGQGAILSAAGLSALLGMSMWFVGSEKLLVLDHGIIIGSFAPFCRPYAIPFAMIEPSTIRVVTGGPVALRKEPGLAGIRASTRTCLWSRSTLLFTGPRPRDLRPRPHRDTTNPPSSPPARTWAFTTRNATTRTALLQALRGALHEAAPPQGTPGGPGTSS